MEACSHCEEVFLITPISSPKSFEKTLRVVRDNLADGTIVESGFWPKGTLRSCVTPFNEVNGAGPYIEDIYEYYFECPRCNQIFHLHCNTYHGRGGTWKPVDERHL